LDIVHTDLCGPIITNGLNDEQYFVILVDDYTIMIVDRFLKNKSEAFEKFNIYKEMVEIDTFLKIKCLRSNNGGKFTSKEFTYFCGEHGIKRKFSASTTLQQNGVAKRKKKTI
jgi:transposase InsO family protein